MLRELHIRNLAVIEDARIELAPGLVVFTGQTGAGKSLVLGAFEILLGLRTVGDLLRPGAEEGRVTGVFELNDADVLAAVIAEADLPADAAPSPGEPLILVRKLFASGRSSASLNGTPIPLATLRAVGERLIDLHAPSAGGTGPATAAGGASESLQLLRPARQLELLDEFAGLHEEVAAYNGDFQRYRTLQRRLEELSGSTRLREERLDLLRFQAAEIDDAEPTPGEFEELNARFRILNSLQRILADAGRVHAALYDSEDSILDRLHLAVALLRELAELDEQFEESRALVESAVAQLQDASFSISRYLGRTDLDAGELGEITDRLNVLNRLISKYGARGCLDSVLEFRAQIGREIDELAGDNADLDDLAREIAGLERSLRLRAESLHAARTTAAKRLAEAILPQLAELALEKARIEIEVRQSSDLGPRGLDEVEMLISPNPGQPLRPLRKIASGGELSRVMLALKTVLAGRGGTAVLVFDEIDAKVGGRLGTVLGTRLRAIAQRHQVLCISHLPQIAAFADLHLKVIKDVADDETSTTVEPLLTVDDRIEEIADMLAGRDRTDTTRAQARELLLGSQAETSAPPDVKVPKTGRKKTAKR